MQLEVNYTFLIVEKKMSDSTRSTDSNTSHQRSLNVEGLKLHVLTHKIDVALWVIRILTVIFTIGYFIPLFG